MGRLSDLRTHVNYELEMIPDPKTRTSAVAHLYGVSLAATMLAKKRRLFPYVAAEGGTRRGRGRSESRVSTKAFGI